MRLRPSLAALSIAALASTAHAGITSLEAGNIESVPLYRGLAFASIDFAAETIEGTEYVSNVGPRPSLNTTALLRAGGATLSARGQSAYAGLYAARNFAEITVANANAGDTYYQVAGFGTATTVRFFTPEAAAARAVFTWRVTGVESAHAPGIGGRNTGRLDFGATTNPNANWTHLFTDDNNELTSFTEFGVGTYTYSLPIADLGEAINLFYWSSAFAQVDPGQVPQGANFTLTANYANTAVLEDVQLLDANDVALAEWELFDELAQMVAFDQNGRQAPVIDPDPLPDPLPIPTSVPAPATGLLAIALLLIARTLRRERPCSA